MLGEISHGLKCSKSRKYLNQSDEKIDSVHIYWIHKTNSVSP